MPVVNRSIICGIVSGIVSKLKAGFTSPSQAVYVRIAVSGSRSKTAPSLVTAASSGNESGMEDTERMGGG